MTWLEEITKSAPWGELASIAALSVLAFSILKCVIVNTYNKFRLSKALSARHVLSFIIRNEQTDNAILRCHTYFRRKIGFSIAFGQWLPYNDIPINGNSGTFEIDKNKIFRKSKNLNSSYNFSLEIPNNDSSKEKYFSRLAFHGFIITGRGKALESDENRWLIYFLHPDEPFHIKSGFSWELKNSLLE